MTVTLKRQLSDDDKARIIQIHGRRCFATGHPIAGQDVMHFDHIRAYADGGITDITNIAPMCEVHNKQKGILSLEDFRVKLSLSKFFEAGDRLTLKHLLQYLVTDGSIGAFGRSATVQVTPEGAEIEAADLKIRTPLYTCPTTGWQYFYATLPVSIIDSDDEEDHKIGLQPRFLLLDKVFDLFRHFQRHPVLQPSIGRVHQNRIVLFDGQHKIAALLWNGRKEFECKIYLAPDLRLLNETNISAHDKFAQTRFFASVMVMKLGTEFGAEFEKYRNLEDGQPKSEAGFLRFLERESAETLTKADRNRRFRSYLYNSVLEHDANRLSKLVSTGNRSTDEKPITLDMLGKSLFASFLYTQPVDDHLATDAYQRDEEIDNNVYLMNLLFDHAMMLWNPKAPSGDSTQRRLTRLFRSKSIMAWSEILRDAICGKLDLQDAEDRARPFYRTLDEQEKGRIVKVVQRLVAWPMWNAPADDQIDRVLSDNKSAVKEWLKNNGLTTGYLMGATE